MNYEEHFQQSVDKRNAFWESLGTLDPYVISHAINPAFMGGPKWPSLRQAFINVRTPKGTIIASDGLSDPYDDFDTNPNNQPYNGLGFELYLETTENFEDHNALKNSWQFNLVYQMSQVAASNGNMISLLQEFTNISSELYDTKAPASFHNKDERVGVLLGLKSSLVPKNLELSIEPILVVNITLLTLSELNYIVENGEDGRNLVAQRLSALDKVGQSSLERVSVV